MKRGILLAGGLGTRLLPATKIQNKHLLNILNRPMITFPLETLKSLGVTDILIVSGGNHIGGFADFLGRGNEYGVKLSYTVQEKAGGIAEALGLAEDFAHGEDVIVILADNIFGDLPPVDFEKGKAYLFLKKISDPSRFGVPTLTHDGIIASIEEKPIEPKSPYAVTGLYYYPNDVFEVVKTLKPSERGELEITDVNNYYVNRLRTNYKILDCYWHDAGSRESLAEVTKWAIENNK